MKIKYSIKFLHQLLIPTNMLQIRSVILKAFLFSYILIIVWLFPIFPESKQHCCNFLLTLFMSQPPLMLVCAEFIWLKNLIFLLWAPIILISIITCNFIIFNFFLKSYGNI